MEPINGQVAQLIASAILNQNRSKKSVAEASSVPLTTLDWGSPQGGGPEGCGAAHDYGEGYSNACSPVVLFSSMRTIATYSGASIVTG